MIVNKHNTRSVIPILARIRKIVSDGRGNLVIEMEAIDHQTGLGTNVIYSFSVNLYGLNDENMDNFSVGAAFGGVLTEYSNQEGNLNILSLENHVFLGFIHCTFSKKTNTWYENLYDLYPIANLQYPWLTQ